MGYFCSVQYNQINKINKINQYNQYNQYFLQKIYKVMKKALLLFSGLVVVLLCACSSPKSDPEMEAKLEGVWYTTERVYDEDLEDDIQTEFGFGLYDNHTLKIAVQYSSDGDVAYTIEGEGTWMATSDKLIFTLKESSLAFNFSKWFDYDDRQEIKSEFIEELCGEDLEMIIVSVSDDELVTNDDNERIVYTRVVDEE